MGRISVGPSKPGAGSVYLLAPHHSEIETMTQVGQPAPDFELGDQFDRKIKLSSFKGKCNVMLLFYPLDWTPT